MDTTIETSNIETRKIQAAQRAGLEVAQIGSVKIQMSVLRDNGLLVDLSIAGTSMFSRTASWFELGVMDAKTQDRFTKGRKSLIPDKVEKRLKSVEARMRQVLDKYTYDVTGFKPWRWLAWKAYDKWIEEFSRLKDDFDAIKSEILDNLDSYVDETAEDFTKISAAAWKSIIGQGFGGAEVDGVAYYDVDTFTDAIIARVISKMPTSADIEARLIADYRVSLVYGQQDVAEDQAKAEAYWEAVKQQKAQTELIEAEVSAQTIANRERQVKLDAIRAAEMEHARKQIEEVGSPFSEIIGQLRGRFAEDAKSMLESIKKNGFVRGKVAEKGRGLIEFFDIMAAHDDTELRSLLDNLKTAIGETPDGRNLDGIENILSGIADLAAASSEELTEVGRAAFVSI